MQKFNKILLISAPSLCSEIDIPYLSIPLLAGQLRNANYNVEYKDFHIECYNYIKRKDVIKQIYDKIEENFKQNKTSENKNNLYKFKFANILYKDILENIEQKKYSDDFFNKLYHFIKLSYKETYNLNYESIKKQCFDENSNFFIEFYKSKIENLPKDFDIIGISQLPSFDIYPTLTLARMIKEKYKNAKIVLGGYWFNYIKQEIKKYPDLFNTFCDYIIAGDGENAIIELAKYINSEININQVSNLIYKSNRNKIIINPEISKVNINNLSYADYSDINFEHYNRPYTITMTLSKGCYWGKCLFCTYTKQNKHFQIKTIQNAIKEIKYYTEKDNVKTILFIDDAISPEYYYKLSKELLKNNIKIKFASYTMFDKGFTYKVLKKCKEAGLEHLTWGLETHSKKVFDTIKKSGCFEERANILRYSHLAGIKNRINIIESLPGEQLEDLLKTIKFIYDNINYIDSFGIQKFRVVPTSGFLYTPEKYGLNILNKDDFSLTYEYVNTKTDINNSNSFIKFICKYSKLNMHISEKELLQKATEAYLRLHAPNLL